MLKVIFNKKIKWQYIIFFFVLISLVVAFTFILIELIRAPGAKENILPGQRMKSDYVLMLLQCGLGIIAMFIPTFLNKKFHMIIPSNMMILYTLFLYSAIYLGEVRSFYYNVPHWDTVLHTFSGAMLGTLGFSIVTILNKQEKVPITLSPLFVSLFAFCFAITLDVFWEVYEFTADRVLGTNMQKFGTESGVLFMGRAALMDTMKDLIVDIIGAGIISIIGYISLKDKKNWLDRLLVRKL